MTGRQPVDSPARIQARAHLRRGARRQDVTSAGESLADQVDLFASAGESTASVDTNPTNRRAAADRLDTSAAARSPQRTERHIDD